LNYELLEFGSLFSGAGGLDLGLERAGLRCKFQVENGKHELTILRKHFPDVPKNEVRPCMGIVGGDPCPIRSIAKNIHGSRQADMSGYFLAMVARCKPRWVLRENVPAPDVVEFELCLAVLGYRTIIIRADSAAVTGQSRARDYVVGVLEQKIFDSFRDACSVTRFSKRNYTAAGEASKAIACLSTRRQRMDTSQMYVFEGPGRGLRVFSHAEREALQGFPAGWTDGVPDTARERMTGNAVTVPVAKWLGERIVEALNG
jgi:DNA (cytosine-5)-methyltransferase 1